MAGNYSSSTVIPKVSLNTAPVLNAVNAAGGTNGVTGVGPANLTFASAPSPQAYQLAVLYYNGHPTLSPPPPNPPALYPPVIGNGVRPTLWLGFYNTMVDALSTVPILNGAAPLNPNNPVVGYRVPRGIPLSQPGKPLAVVPVAAVPLAPRLAPVPPATMGKISPAVPGTQFLQQFRSPLRDVSVNNTNFLSAAQTVLLRSLLAAVNAADLADSDDDLTVASIPFATYSATVSSVAQPARLTVYGFEKQPFITQIYANNDFTSNTQAGNKTNLKGYVAVELYNPYDVSIDMQGWQLGLIYRDPTAASPNPAIGTVQPLGTGFTFPAGPNSVIPAHGYMILENFNGGDTNDATYRPFANYKNMPALAPSGTVVIVPVTKLHLVMKDQWTVPDPNTGKTPTGGELVILRPYTANASLAPSTTLSQMAPVDSFDFTGIEEQNPANPNNSQFTALHYVRANPGNYDPVATPVPTIGATPAGSQMWRFVYPGCWTNQSTNTGVGAIRQEGVSYVQWIKANPAPGNVDPWVLNPPPANGQLLQAQILFGTALAVFFLCECFLRHPTEQHRLRRPAQEVGTDREQAAPGFPVWRICPAWRTSCRCRSSGPIRSPTALEKCWK